MAVQYGQQTPDSRHSSLSTTMDHSLLNFSLRSPFSFCFLLGFVTVMRSRVVCLSLGWISGNSLVFWVLPCHLHHFKPAGYESLLFFCSDACDIHPGIQIFIFQFLFQVTMKISGECMAPASFQIHHFNIFICYRCLIRSGFFAGLLLYNFNETEEHEMRFPCF